MKTLLLVRHAKSVWGDLSLPDRDRPLTARGEHDVARMAKRFAKRHRKLDLIESSPALRALATATGLARGLGYNVDDIVVNECLYAASADDLMDLVEQLDDRWDRVMLIGHNPGLAELAGRLSSAITRMPTCAAAEFTFDVTTWSGVGRVRPAAMKFDAPKASS